jgi:hypothetical protein
MRGVRIGETGSAGAEREEEHQRDIRLYHLECSAVAVYSFKQGYRIYFEDGGFWGAAGPLKEPSAQLSWSTAPTGPDEAPIPTPSLPSPRHFQNTMLYMHSHKRK